VATKLFVGGLPYSVTDDELQELFAPFGTITSAKVIIDRETNRSKGFGFVEMENDDEAKAAIAEMHDKEIGGRKIAVNEARPQERRERPAFGGGNGGGRRDNFGGGRRY
jgi:RNA recognition motif-containing protein